MSIQATTTTAGRQAILDAIAGGSTITVASLVLAGLNQTANASTTSLASVVATLDATGSVRPAGSGHALHVTAKDDSAASYSIRAFALQLSTGDYLMVYSQSGAIATKASGSSLHFALDLTIDADTAATVTFGDTDFELPAASETTAGVVELATNAEVNTGTDALRAVTPAGLLQRLTSLNTLAGFLNDLYTWGAAHSFGGNVTTAGQFRFSSERPVEFLVPLGAWKPSGLAGNWVLETVGAEWVWVTTDADQQLIGEVQIPLGMQVQSVEYGTFASATGSSQLRLSAWYVENSATPQDHTLLLNNLLINNGSGTLTATQSLQGLATVTAVVQGNSLRFVLSSDTSGVFNAARLHYAKVKGIISQVPWV